MIPFCHSKWPRTDETVLYTCAGRPGDMKSAALQLSQSKTRPVYLHLRYLPESLPCTLGQRIPLLQCCLSPPSPQGTFEPQRIFLVVPAQEYSIATVDGDQMFLKSSRAQDSPHSVPETLCWGVCGGGRGGDADKQWTCPQSPSWSSPSGEKTDTVQIRRSEWQVVGRWGNQ